MKEINKITNEFNLFKLAHECIDNELFNGNYDIFISENNISCKEVVKYIDKNIDL